MRTPVKNTVMYYIGKILVSQGKVNFSNIEESFTHDGLTRSLSKKHQWQTLFWSFISYFVELSGGYLILDDTILEKPYSTVNGLIRYVFSHKENKSIKGIQIVLVLLIVANIRIPIGFRIYDGRKTKIELALEIFSELRNRLKLRKMMVLFDSWYPAKKILKRLNDYGWHYVCRIKKNRKISKVQVKKLFPSPYGVMEGIMSGLKIKVVRHGKYYLITNMLTLTKEEIRNWYLKRSAIEEFFKEIKTYFNAKSCQSRTREAWENHIFLVNLSFCIVEFKRQESMQTVYKLKQKSSFEDYHLYLNLWNSILGSA